MRTPGRGRATFPLRSLKSVVSTRHSFQAVSSLLRGAIDIREIKLTKSTNERRDAVVTYGIRLRFRTAKDFTTTASTIPFEVDGREVVLASQDGRPSERGGWYTLRAAGFVDQSEATVFGRRLGVALQIASIRRMLGVDLGSDRATSSVGKVVSDELAKQGVFIRPDVHGLDVFEDRPGTEWLSASLEGFISTDAAMVLNDIIAVVEGVGTNAPAKFDAVQLLNEALFSVEAPAQLTLQQPADAHRGRARHAAA